MLIEPKSFNNLLFCLIAGDGLDLLLVEQLKEGLLHLGVLEEHFG